MPVSFSATHTVTSSARRPSLPLRAYTLVLSSTAARRLPSLSATFSPYPSCQKVPSSQTLRRRSATVVPLPGLLETTLPLSVTRPMTTRPVFVSPVEPRRRSLEAAVLPLVLSLVVDVSTSLCSRLAVHTTSTRLSVTSAYFWIW